MSRGLRWTPEQLTARGWRDPDKPDTVHPVPFSRSDVQPSAEFQALLKPQKPARAPKRGKYHSVPTDGYASAKEAKRASELRLLEKAGSIRRLREQVVYELIPAQYQDGKCVERACSYKADFVYEEPLPPPSALARAWWVEVVEDCKGMRTKDYIIKRKLMLHLHKIRIRET